MLKDTAVSPVVLVSVRRSRASCSSLFLFSLYAKLTDCWLQLHIYRKESGINLPNYSRQESKYFPKMLKKRNLIRRGCRVCLEDVSWLIARWFDSQMRRCQNIPLSRTTKPTTASSCIPPNLVDLRADSFRARVWKKKTANFSYKR